MKTNSQNYCIADFLEQFLIAPLKDATYLDITNLDVKGENQVTVFADPSFQRRYGAWTSKMKSKYIESIFQDRIFTQIVFASCTPKYKEKWNLGPNVEWTNLDGQHRSHVIKEFVNDEFGFTGYSTDGRKNIYCQNRTFSSLSPREQKMFLRKTVEVKTISDVSETTFSDIFINVNDGEALNNQERLNAIDCTMSWWTRSVEEEHWDVFKKVSKVKAHLNRMSAREFLTKLYINAKGLSENSMTSLTDKNISFVYKDEDGNVVTPDQEVLDYISNDLMTSLGNVSRSLKNQMATRNIWTFAAIHHLLFVKGNSNYLDISETFTDETLWAYSCDVNAFLMRQSKVQEAADEEASTPGKNSPYYHAEISRYHTSHSAEFVCGRIFEYTGGVNDLITSLQSFEKRLEVVKAA